MKRKKLLVFHRTIAPYRIDFFNKLYQLYDTRICLFYWNLKGQKFDYQKIYDQFDFEPVYLPQGSFFKQCCEAWRQIKDFSPDLIMACEFGPVTIMTILARLLLKRKYKIVVTADDSYDMVSKGNDFSFSHKTARKIIPSFVDNLVVVEPRVEKWFQERYKKGIYFPIIIEDKKAIERYHKLMPISKNYAIQYDLFGGKVLLSVSRLAEEKNLYRVIEAFSKIKTDATYVIVGDGPERESLEQYAKRFNKRIVFVGRYDGDALYAWYNLASVFILASTIESFGAVTNEALLAGCRVVISNKAGSSCLVDKNNGELVDPYDVYSISSAIEKQLALSSIPTLTEGRTNLMIETFNERFNELIKIL